MADYPECEKLSKVSRESQKLGDFLEWLKGQGYYLCKFYDRETLDASRDQSEEGFYPDYISIIDILAKYFDIDMNKVEEERAEILKKLREQN